MHLLQVVPPATEPISVSEVKPYLKLDGDAEDDLLAKLIVTARGRVEHHIRRSLITQTWELLIHEVETWLYLPRPPIQSIVKVTVDDVEVPSDKYCLGRGGTFYCSIPLRSVFPDGVVIRYVAGYGDTGDAVPQPIRQAILITVAQLYEDREGQSPEGLPPAAKALLRPYRELFL